MLKVEKRPSESRLSRRLATTSDLPVIAKIHRLAYSRSHFTALLPEKVLMLYYERFLSGGTEICLAVNTDIGPTEAVQGFAVYGVGIPQKIAAFKRECRASIVLTSLRYPGISARKALRAVRGKLAAHKPVPPADFLLLSIAVAQPLAGVGKGLLSGMREVAHERGHDIVGLYVNIENIRALNSYYAAGFRIKDFNEGQYYMEAATTADSGYQ